MPDRGGRKQIFHVNHLSKWKERPCQVNSVIEDGEGIEEYRWTSSGQEIQFGQELSEDKKEGNSPSTIRISSSNKRHPWKNQPNHSPDKDSRPIRQKPYRIPQAYKEKVFEELEDMEKNGIIEKSESEWASPLVIVTKKDGGVRLCVDYRQLNQITKFDAYPMPRIEELLDKIGSARFITTLDLAKGYWQVPMNPEDRDKTAFVSPKGLYQFMTMPFGLSGAPATFQRMMDEVLRGTESFAGDDIIIHSDTWEDHLRHLDEALKRLEDAGLTLKLKKCTFATEDCTYLGYRIGRGGVKLENSKVQAVAEMS